MFFALFLSTYIICSCTVIDTGEKNRDIFISEYKNAFLNSDLVLFSYNPRVQFEGFTDSVQYRFFLRQDNKLLITLWSDRKQLDTTDRIQRLIANYLDFISINEDSIRNTNNLNIGWLGKDRENRIVLFGDSNKVFPIPHNTFTFDPISYFSKLDSLVHLYGIIAIKKYPDYIKLIFDSDKSLMYFPNVIKPDTCGMNLSLILDKWYISNETVNLDYY